MPRALKIYISGVVAVGAGALAATTFLFPVDPAIALGAGGPDQATTEQTLAGIVFWIVLTLLASALPVHVPGGSSVAVSNAPVFAAMSLGGPAVGAWVAALGTTEFRELRGRIPWYGSLANHAGIVIPAAAGGLICTFIGRRTLFDSFLGLVLAGVVYTVLNMLLASLLLSLRTRQPARSIFLRYTKELFASLWSLAPLAWLMSVMYGSAWWASLVFALPLYTTRLAYHRFVEMREMFTQTISSLAQAVDKRDKYTSGHSLRVKEIAVDIGRELRCSDSELEALEWGGLLHDVGKIGVADSILLKQERLTREERIIMNTHPVLGAEIIAPVTKLAPELPIIRHHHEWYNGSGYPDRLMGDEIPRLARVLHVADAFEAMTAARPYRMKPLSPDQALSELRKYAGIQFDPVMVDAFVKTKWVADAADAGRDIPPRPVPLISQAAGRISKATALADKSTAPVDH